MITKEHILENLKNPILGDTHRAILKLALKGLEYEDLMCEHRIAVNNLHYEVDGLNRSRNFLLKQYDSLVGQSANEIKKLQDESNAKTKTIFEASQIIDDMRAKYRALEEELANFNTRYDQLCRELIIQTDHLKIGRQNADDQIAVLEDQLKNTVTRQYHDGIVVSAARQIVSLRDERDALKTENQSLKDSREKLIASVIGMK